MAEKKLISGIHHVTAMVSDAQSNLDFYAGVLGLRLVKKTVNFDAPEVYHLYYGNEKGDPGTIITFFPYPTLPKGRIGNGQLTVTSFSIGQESIDFWLKRLVHFKIEHIPPQKRFEDEIVISLKDPDGILLELVANSKDKHIGFDYAPIPIEHAIKGFYGITLSEEGYTKTASTLTEFLNYQFVEQKSNRFRYSIENTPGDYVDILCNPDALRGSGGVGTVHHVAFATKNEETQHIMRQKLFENGFNITPVLDREYFRSIYFREPGGVLFEIATLPPGFTVDEDLKELGNHLKLPSWYESHRSLIESVLPPIQLDIKRFFNG